MFYSLMKVDLRPINNQLPVSIAESLPLPQGTNQLESE
jgi:hypothetical protein